MVEKYIVTREQLADSFQELVDDELKKFKSKLTYIKMKKKINNIPRAEVMKADNEDLAEILVQHYGSDYAVKVVLKALKKINKRSLAEILLHELKEKIKSIMKQEDETDDDDDDDDDESSNEETSDEESSDDESRDDESNDDDD